MMNYYMMESPAAWTAMTSSSSTGGCGEAELDFDLLFSLDTFDDKDFFFGDDEKQQLKNCFMSPRNSLQAMNQVLELDAFDEVSLLSSSDDEVPCMAPMTVKNEMKKSSGKRKRNSAESQTIDETASQCSSNKKQKGMNSSNPNAAADYTNKFIKALNYGDMSEMHNSLQEICSQQVKVTKHFYPTIEELRAQEEYNRTHPDCKQEEFLSTMQFHNIHDFLHYVNMIGLMIPDGSFAIDNVRSSYEGGNSSIYMAAFTYSGTSLCGNMNLLSNKMSLLDYNEAMMLNVINHSCAQKSLRKYKTEGSIALYVNKEGLINEVEFFETRSVF